MDDAVSRPETLEEMQSTEASGLDVEVNVGFSTTSGDLLTAGEALAARAPGSNQT